MTLHGAPAAKRPPAAERPPKPARPWAVRWGEWAARRHWWVLSVWLVVFVLSAALYPRLESALVSPDYSVTGSDSDRVAQLVEENFTSAGTEQDVVVFDSKSLTYRDPAYRKVVDRVVADVRDATGVVSVIGPADPGAQGQVSQDGHAALAAVGLSGDVSARADHAQDLQDAITSSTSEGPVQAYLAGFSPSSNDLTTVETTDVERAESIGVPVAFVVLFVALAALVAAGVPLILALASLTFTFGVVALLTAVMDFDVFVVSVMTMIGVGVGIDYSLFILSRFREELARRGHQRDAVPSAVGASMTTSGRTIAYSGVIVMLALFSLFVVRSPMFREMALGCVIVVACTLVSAWTLLPALLGALGNRVNRGALPKRFQPAEDDPETGAATDAGGWARWARTVLSHPWLALPAVAVLLVLSLPVFNLKLGIDMGLAALEDQPSGKADAVLAEAFSPGVMAPDQILVSHRGGGPLTTADLKTVDDLTTTLSHDRRVTQVYSISTVLRQTSGQVSAPALAALEKSTDPAVTTQLGQVVNVDTGGDRTIITVIPRAAVDSKAATTLVDDLRDRTIPSLSTQGGPEMLVGGSTAQIADLSTETLAKLWVVIGIVLVLSFLYLMVVFRSVLLPAKAVVMNLLATGAAFGLTTWVFQQGHLEGLLDFTSAGFIQVYLPIMTFAFLFGLSMDYEVFLIRRMQEQWQHTEDIDDAVTTGIARTARPIAAAAAIMAAVFGCYVVADVLELKEFGLALAAAVVLDATLVRLLIVPAFMKVAGRANWWLPGWLDRVLPRLPAD